MGVSNKESWNSASSQIVKEFKEKPECSILQLCYSGTIILLPIYFIHALVSEGELYASRWFREATQGYCPLQGGTWKKQNYELSDYRKPAVSLKEYVYSLT